MAGAPRIRSTRNARVAAAASLSRARERRRRGRMLLEGPNLLGEAVDAGIGVETVFGRSDDAGAARMAADAGAEWVEVDEPVLRRLAETRNPRGPVSVAVIPPSRTPTGDVLWLDAGDPGNVGTLVRTAAAFGYGVSLGIRAADPWSPKVLRASAGTVFRVEVATDGSLPAESVLVATVARGGTDVREVAGGLDRDRPWAVLVGDEASGIPQETLERADLRVTIPMPGGTESLNAAVAGAIVAYELRRVRNSDGAGGAAR